MAHQELGEISRVLEHSAGPGWLQQPGGVVPSAGRRLLPWPSGSANRSLRDDRVGRGPAARGSLPPTAPPSTMRSRRATPTRRPLLVQCAHAPAPLRNPLSVCYATRRSSVGRTCLARKARLSSWRLDGLTRECRRLLNSQRPAPHHAQGQTWLLLAHRAQGLPGSQRGPGGALSLSSERRARTAQSTAVAMDDLGQSGWLAAARSDASPRRCERKLPALLLRELEARRAPKTAGGGRSLRREAVGEFRAVVRK